MPTSQGNIGAESPDEMSLAVLLPETDMTVFDGDEEAEQELVRWTKYCTVNGREEPPYQVSLEDDYSVVPVQSPVDGGFALVLRCLEGVTPLEDGKERRDYSIVGWWNFADAESITDHVRLVYNATRLKVARKIEGFGS